MIPKKIHYCWVGGAPKPKSVQYCIDSWKKYCPDYEIIEWNESNYDFKKNKYMAQAYEAKKWGFVPDYARLDIIYNHGGIYLDTDVEAIKSFDDILDNKSFFGFEDTGEGTYFVALGLGFGSEPHNELFKRLMDCYANIDFVNADGSLNLTPSPQLNSPVFSAVGFSMDNKLTSIDGNTVYPSQYFCPKIFKTGKTRITKNTISIHHFSASWMDENIKKEIDHIQRVKGVWGDKLGSKVLILESAYKKYRIKGAIKKVISTAHNHLYGFNYLLAPSKRKRVKSNKIAVFDTSMFSKNQGDSIIMDYCLKQLVGNLPSDDMIKISTHRFPSVEDQDALAECNTKILCGTNLLSGRMRSYGLWKIPKDLRGYNNIIPMGVGFDSNSTGSDLYTRILYKKIFSKKGYISVRDSFSERKLKAMGVANVLNTSCPTLWNLSEEFCRSIPQTKSNEVVFTLTDYCTDQKQDKALINILVSNYDKVYYWIQGSEDLEYLIELGYDKTDFELIYSLEDYDHILDTHDIDYVGTRLHAGIRALNHGRRSLIVSVDNRAESIAKDTNLPIILRDEIDSMLADKINSCFKTEIILPERNIQLWKEQFYRNN